MSLEEILRLAIEKKLSTEAELRQLKSVAAGKSGKLASNSELLALYRELIDDGGLPESLQLTRLLTKRKIRSLSGVSVVAVLTKPFGCPGECTFCPTEQGMPKSYLSNQPGAMRAVRNEFDPFRQVTERLQSLKTCGHPAQKIELIILGGTWTALPRNYQTWFVKCCLQALNQSKTSSIKALQKENEEARHRLVGFTIETRPDWLNLAEIKRLRWLGVTRVELGAQSIYDDVLQGTQRGHSTDKTVEAVRLLKNAGMKVGLHLMPNLPRSSPAKDLAMFQEIFEGEDYCPDQIKIYPCSVLPGTKLERDWRAKKYKPYSDQRLAKLIGEVYKVVPEYCRISRVVRDIPTGSILAGAKISNLRQVLEQAGIRAHDIREREIKGELINPTDLRLVERRYKTAGGLEVFLAFEDQSKAKLVSFCRLRLPYQVSNKQLIKAKPLPLAGHIAFIREVHSYGFETPIGEKGKASQHRGFGKKLIMYAESLAKKARFKKILVPAGCGVRPYYRKLGYQLQGTYMVKFL